jgi:hypothetical protein
MQNRTLLGIVLLVSIIIVGLFTLELRLPLKDKESYGAYDFAKDPWLASFAQEYKDARLNHSSWVVDPIALALRVAGYPNIDGTNPDQVDIYYVNSTKLVVVIKDFGLMDDSVESRDIRVDLVKKGDIWEVEWAGLRQRCRRGLIIGWTTSGCP